MPQIEVGPEFDDLQGALSQIEQLSAPLAEQAIGRIVAHLYDTMSPYPPQPDRDRANPGNKPSPYNTYVRGIGHFPRSSFVQINGAWQRKGKGAYKPDPKNGKVRFTSQQLGHKWRMSVTREGNAVTGELRNEAGYSGSVLGFKGGGEEPQQSEPHTKTGWPNLTDSLNAIQPTIDAEFDQVADEVIKLLKGS